MNALSDYQLTRRAPEQATMHPSTFEYLTPTDEQMAIMTRVRAAAKEFADLLEAALPDGPDKTFVLRNHRASVMWAYVAITRHPDGTPR